MRGTPIEWNLFGSGDWDYGVNAQNIYNYWVVGAQRAKPFESIYTMGMRGAGDCTSGFHDHDVAVFSADDVFDSTALGGPEHRPAREDHFGSTPDSDERQSRNQHHHNPPDVVSLYVHHQLL